MTGSDDNKGKIDSSGDPIIDIIGSSVRVSSWYYVDSSCSYLKVIDAARMMDAAISRESSSSDIIHYISAKIVEALCDFNSCFSDACTI